MVRLLICFLICVLTIDLDAHEPITIESALTRTLQYNREILDALEYLRKADIRLSTENAYFSWEVTPNGIFGYTNGPNKHNDTDLSYGVGVSLSKCFTYGSKLYFKPSVSKKGKGFQADLSTTFVQPLFRGSGKGYILSRVYAAKFSRRAAYRQFFIKQTRIIQDAIKRLYTVIKQEAIAKMNQESLQRLTHLVETTKLKESVGLATATDIYRAEHELKNTEERYTSSLVQIKEAQDRVREILSLPEDAPITINVPVTEFSEEIPLQQAIEMALQNRVEIDQAMDALGETKRLCVLDKQELLPDLNLVFEFTNASYYDSFRVIHPDNYHKYWKVGLTTSKGLCIQGSINRMELSRLAVQSSKRNVERITDNIVSEVKQSQRRYNNLKKKIDIQKEQLELSEMNLNLSSLKFNRGLANNFNLIEAEKNLQQEQIRLFTQTIDHMIEFLNLRVAMGVFCEKPRIPY